MKIFIADSQSRIRFGLRILLEQQPGWIVTGEFAGTDELIERARIEPPDLILLDWDWPARELEVQMESLRELCPGILIVSLSGRYELRQAALDAGVDAFASKAEPPEKLIQLIRQLFDTSRKSTE